LWVGQFVSVALRLYVEERALVIPSQAVVTGQNGTYVYVIDSAKTARQSPVVLERTAGPVAVIASGLADGVPVVTEGMSRLTPGAPVDLRGGEGVAESAGRAGGKRPSSAPLGGRRRER